MVQEREQVQVLAPFEAVIGGKEQTQRRVQWWVQLCSQMVQERVQAQVLAPFEAVIGGKEQTQLKVLLWELTYPLTGLELGLVLEPFAREICGKEQTQQRELSWGQLLTLMAPGQEQVQALRLVPLPGGIDEMEQIRLKELWWELTCQQMDQEQELEQVPSEGEIVLREQTQPKELLWVQTFPLMGLVLAQVLGPFAEEIGEMERWHLTALS